MSSTQITARKARNLVRRFLETEGIGFNSLKAKTVGFTDLARASAVFVYIHGVAAEHHASLKCLGEAHGFGQLCVQFIREAIPSKSHRVFYEKRTYRLC